MSLLRHDRETDIQKGAVFHVKLFPIQDAHPHLGAAGHWPIYLGITDGGGGGIA